jgi:Uncharacterized metal-binding protein
MTKPEGERHMITVTFFPGRKQVKVRPGTTLLEAARRARVVLPSRCNGNASCTRCRVIVPPAAEVSPLREVERRRLPEGAIAAGVRLGCQTRVYKAVTVTVPAQSAGERPQRTSDPS